MYTREYEGSVLRKANRSGAGNDCVYLTAPDAPTALILDSKREAALRVSSEARLGLLRMVARSA